MKRFLIAYSIFTTILLIVTLVLSWHKIENSLYSHYKIVMFGDSLTDGWNNVSYLHKSDAKISGNPGFTTSHFLFKVRSDVLVYKPDTCYIEGGINDIGVGIPMKRTFNNYKNLIDTLQANKIVPVVQSTLYKVNDEKTNQDVDSLNCYLIKLCTNKHVRFIDLNKRMSANNQLRPDLTIDGTHLNKKGYKVWSELIN